MLSAANKRLPKDVRIEFDVRSEGADGDIKWEAFGDGRNHASGYVFIFGGWHNREVRIAKLDEHAPTESELLAWCRNEMANFKVPRHLEFVPAFPLNPSGKVLKFELRDRARKAIAQ